MTTITREELEALRHEIAGMRINPDTTTPDDVKWDIVDIIETFIKDHE